MSRKLRAIFGPEPQVPPGLTPRHAHAFAEGWTAACNEESVNANEYRQRDMADAWEAGWRAYYDVYLATHRVRACDRQEAA